MIELSVICPMYNEEKYIGQFMDSVLQQDFPHDCLEILLVDGMSNDNTRTIINEYTKQYSFIKLLDNPNKIVPYAMNIGIKACKGNIVMRLDVHASYQPNYFSVLTQKLIELNADNVGTVCKTDVLHKTSKTLAIKEVLSNKFGVGNSTFRTGIDKVKEVDTVPFGCWKKSVFDKYGLYDVRLVRNQDIELNKRIKHGGGKIYIVPDTYCTYLARETYKSLAKNNYANGKWNILTVFYTKDLRSLSLRHFIPLLFVLSLLVPILASLFYFPLIYIAVITCLLYLMLIIAISFKIAIKKQLNICFLVYSFVVLHTSYGFGSLCGILQLPLKIRKNVNTKSCL